MTTHITDTRDPNFQFPASYLLANVLSPAQIELINGLTETAGAATSVDEPAALIRRLADNVLLLASLGKGARGLVTVCNGVTALVRVVEDRDVEDAPLGLRLAIRLFGPNDPRGGAQATGVMRMLLQNQARPFQLALSVAHENDGDWGEPAWLEDTADLRAGRAANGLVGWHRLTTPEEPWASVVNTLTELPPPDEAFIEKVGAPGASGELEA